MKKKKGCLTFIFFLFAMAFIVISVILMFGVKWFLILYFCVFVLCLLIFWLTDKPTIDEDDDVC